MLDCGCSSPAPSLFFPTSSLSSLPPLFPLRSLARSLSLARLLASGLRASEERAKERAGERRRERDEEKSEIARRTTTRCRPLIRQLVSTSTFFHSDSFSRTNCSQRIKRKPLPTRREWRSCCCRRRTSHWHPTPVAGHWSRGARERGGQDSHLAVRDLRAACARGIPAQHPYPAPCAPLLLLSPSAPLASRT